MFHESDINTRMMYIVRIFYVVLIITLLQFANFRCVEVSDNDNSQLSEIFDVEQDEESTSIPKKNMICDTKECQIIANEFSRGMNKSVAPCENFYDFVCGAWADENTIPDFEPMWSRFHIFQNTVNQRIKGILDTEPEPADILPVRQAKKWYRACLDVTILEKRGLKPIEAVLLQVGGWPMTLDPEEWNENEHSWESVEHDYFHITGDYVFYHISKGHNEEFNVMLQKGSIPLHRKLPSKYRNYTGDNYETYAELITGVTQTFVEHNKAAVTQEMIQIDVRNLIDFEKQLFLLSESIEKYDYDEWNITEFIEWYTTNMTELKIDDELKKIDFKNLIQRQFDLVNREILNSDNIVVDSHSYYLRLTALLNKTPTRTIVNYINWHFVSDMLIYTTEAMRDLFFLLMKNEFDVKARPPRWLECIKEMKMTNAASYGFVEKYFSEEVEETGREMIENVRQVMAQQIENSNYLDEDSKIVATEKLYNMTMFIGFPDWYKNETSVLNSYKGLTIGFDHFDNVLSFKKYRTKKELRAEISTSFSILDIASMIDPTQVNAFYVPWKNIVVLPAADFQPPLFTSRVPLSVNYGIVGLAVGHEIGHGFDDSGIQMGHDGNRTKISEDILEMYEERADCFIKQFSKYYSGSDNANYDAIRRGRMTRPDNIADSTGLQAVFKAFKKLIDEHDVPNYKLPGFEDYTDDQMFFIAFAAMWCEMVTPKYEEKRSEIDFHSPGRFRVMGAISNTDEFGQVFNCPIGSPMNPENKCNIWQTPPNSDVKKKSNMFKRRRRLGWIKK